MCLTHWEEVVFQTASACWKQLFVRVFIGACVCLCIRVRGCVHVCFSVLLITMFSSCVCLQQSVYMLNVFLCIRTHRHMHYVFFSLIWECVHVPCCGGVCWPLERKPQARQSCVSSGQPPWSRKSSFSLKRDKHFEILCVMNARVITVSFYDTGPNSITKSLFSHQYLIMCVVNLWWQHFQNKSSVMVYLNTFIPFFAFI